MRTRPIDLSDLHDRIDAANVTALDVPPPYHALPETRSQPTTNVVVATSDENAQQQQQRQYPAAAGIPQDVSDDDEDDSEDDSEDDELLYDEDEEEEEEELQAEELLGQQDWDNVSGDLTKRYNRLKQHIGAIQRQPGPPASSSIPSAAATAVQPLPAQNQFAQRQRQLQLQAQRRAQHQAAAAATAASASAPSLAAAPGVHASKLDSSLAALSSRYSSALNLSLLSSAQSASGGTVYAAEPSFTSNAATRKGGSERHAVNKDKSDRATVEQVLDDRTRLVLYKMLGRGRLERVEGCVSTGKEVSLSDGAQEGLEG